MGLLGNLGLKALGGLLSAGFDVQNLAHEYSSWSSHDLIEQYNTISYKLNHSNDISDRWGYSKHTAAIKQVLESRGYNFS